MLLQALAINTIGIPKERWYPNVATAGFRVDDDVRKSMTITSPRLVLNNIDWGNFWTFGWNLVGGGDSSWDAALGLAAASTYALLAHLPDPFESSPVGWQLILGEVDGSVTAIDTAINETVARTISVQKSRVRDIFNHLRENGTRSYYEDAIGWNGFINITVPTLTTSCVPGLAMNESVAIGTMPVS